MQNHFLSLIFIVSLVVCSSYSSGPGLVGGKERTGSPGAEGTCANCHLGGAFNAVTLLSILDSSGAIINNYQAGHIYALKINISATNAKVFGFQGVALDASNKSVGSFVVPSDVQMVKLSGRNIIEQKSPKSTPSWEVQWKAPQNNTGPIKFYFCGNACNGNKNSTGDQAALVDLTLDVATSVQNVLTNNISAFQCFFNNSQELVAKIYLMKSGNYKISLFDMTGRLVKIEKHFMQFGENKLTMDVRDYPSAIYIMNIANENEQLSTKVLKLKQ